MSVPLPPDEHQLVEQLLDRFSDLKMARNWLPKSHEDVALDPALAYNAIVECLKALRALDDCALELNAMRAVNSPSKALIEIVIAIGSNAQQEIETADEVRFPFFDE
jgi:hypothetical protein